MRAASGAAPVICRPGHYPGGLTPGFIPGQIYHARFGARLKADPSCHKLVARPTGFSGTTCDTCDRIHEFNDRTGFVPPFPGAKVDVQIVRRAIAEIRRDGYAETYNKRIDEGAPISAAVPGPANEVLGAFTVSIPIGRYTAEVRGRTIEVVTRATRALSRQPGAP